MTLYALDDIDDAIAATRALLWPFDLGRWAKLALVAFFIGGTGGMGNPFTSNVPGGSGGTGGSPTTGAGGPIETEVLALVAAVLLVALVVGLALAVVASIFEFVFVESLRRETVALRRYWSRRWRQGLRLLGFRIGLGLLTVAAVAVVIGLAVLPALVGIPAFSVVGVLLAIPLLFALLVVGGIAWGFTSVFVVPVMIAEDCGVLAAWRRFWPTMSGQWKQYAVYAVMGFVLSIAVGLVASIATIVPLLVIAIPLGGLGLVGWALLSTSSLAGWAVIAIAAVVFVVLLLVVVAFVSVPVQTFLRYYALFVLGDTNEDFDLIPERRAAVREDDAAAGSGA